MALIIRAMIKEDWETVALIYKEGIDTGIATFQSEVPSYEEWDKSHIEECRLIAEEDGRIIGWTALSKVNSRCVYSGVAEISIYIKEDSRGRGVGEKLLMELIEESENVGYWTLQSGIIEINHGSIALHKKAGFRMVGYRERIAQDHNGVWQNTVLMERRSKVI